MGSKFFFFFQAEDGIRDKLVTGVQTCALPISRSPARTNTQHEDHLMPENEFPFSSARLADPVTGRTAALLRGDGSDPRLIEVNTSTEYWQKGASLLHTDPLGRRDVALPAGVRAYLVAGTQHGERAGLTAAPGP